MKYIEKAWSLVSQRPSSGSMNQQDTFLLRVPKAGHLAAVFMALHSLGKQSVDV